MTVALWSGPCAVPGDSRLTTTGRCSSLLRGHEFQRKAPACWTATLPPRRGAPDEDPAESTGSASAGSSITGPQHDWTDQVMINVGHRERTHGAFDAAAWFCRRHVDLQRVASALCPAC